MSGPITFDLVAVVSAVLLAAFAFWRWLEARFKASDMEAKMAMKAVDQLRLDMIREYASVTHLKEVENRLVAALDRLTDKIDERWPKSSTRSRKQGDA
jgi:type II secretory pathway pseudopilin PulG